MESSLTPKVRNALSMNLEIDTSAQWQSLRWSMLSFVSLIATERKAFIVSSVAGLEVTVKSFQLVR
jgi:hypothetical protein